MTSIEHPIEVLNPSRYWQIGKSKPGPAEDNYYLRKVQAWDVSLGNTLDVSGVTNLKNDVNITGNNTTLTGSNLTIHSPTSVIVNGATDINLSTAEFSLLTDTTTDISSRDISISATNGEFNISAFTISGTTFDLYSSNRTNISGPSLNINSTTLDINSSNINIKQPDSSFVVEGFTQLNNTLTVKEKVDLCNNLTVKGNSTFNNTSFFNSTSTFNTSSGNSIVVESGDISINTHVYMSGTLHGPEIFYIDPAKYNNNKTSVSDSSGITGTVVIRGNLQVDGTQTTVNSTTVDISDLNITLASNAASATEVDKAGIDISNIFSFRVNETEKRWVIDASSGHSIGLYLPSKAGDGYGLQVEEKSKFNSNVDISSTLTVRDDVSFNNTNTVFTTNNFQILGNDNTHFHTSDFKIIGNNTHFTTSDFKILSNTDTHFQTSNFEVLDNSNTKFNTNNFQILNNDKYNVTSNNGEISFNSFNHFKLNGKNVNIDNSSTTITTSGATNITTSGSTKINTIGATIVDTCGNTTIKTGDNTRVDTSNNTNIESGKNTTIKSGTNTTIESGANTTIESNDLSINTVGLTDISSGTTNVKTNNLTITTNDTINIDASDVIIDTTTIRFPGIENWGNSAYDNYVIAYDDSKKRIKLAPGGGSSIVSNKFDFSDEIDLSTNVSMTSYKDLSNILFNEIEINKTKSTRNILVCVKFNYFHSIGYGETMDVQICRQTISSGTTIKKPLFIEKIIGEDLSLGTINATGGTKSIYSASFIDSYDFSGNSLEPGKYDTIKYYVKYKFPNVRDETQYNGQLGIIDISNSTYRTSASIDLLAL